MIHFIFEKIWDKIRFLLLVLSICTAIFFTCRIRLYIVASGSMEPAIHTGSLILIDIREKNPQIGDVAAFWHSGVVVTHRINKITESGYKTKGDANQTEDLFEVAKDEIVGSYVIAIPYLGYIFRFLQTPFYFFAAGILLCFVIVKSLWKKEKKYEI